MESKHGLLLNIDNLQAEKSDIGDFYTKESMRAKYSKYKKAVFHIYQMDSCF